MRQLDRQVVARYGTESRRRFGSFRSNVARVITGLLRGKNTSTVSEGNIFYLM